MSTPETKQFTGSTTLSEVLSHYGKITDDNARRTITLSLAVTSTCSEVAMGASVSTADTEKALATLSTAHWLVVKAYLDTAKQFASARVTGKTSNRWKSIVTCNKATKAANA